MRSRRYDSWNGIVPRQKQILHFLSTPGHPPHTIGRTAHREPQPPTALYGNSRTRLVLALLADEGGAVCYLSHHAARPVDIAPAWLSPLSGGPCKPPPPVPPSLPCHPATLSGQQASCVGIGQSRRGPSASSPGVVALSFRWYSTMSAWGRRGRGKSGRSECAMSHASSHRLCDSETPASQSKVGLDSG